jgi:hypothetical protein
MTDIQPNHIDETQQFPASKPNCDDRLESLLLEGLDSGEPVPLDDAEWNRIRQEVHQRLASC